MNTCVRVRVCLCARSEVFLLDIDVGGRDQGRRRRLCDTDSNVICRTAGGGGGVVSPKRRFKVVLAAKVNFACPKSRGNYERRGDVQQ